MLIRFWGSETYSTSFLPTIPFYLCCTPKAIEVDPSQSWKLAPHTCKFSSPFSPSLIPMHVFQLGRSYIFSSALWALCLHDQGSLWKNKTEPVSCSSHPWRVHSHFKPRLHLLHFPQLLQNNNECFLYTTFNPKVQGPWEASSHTYQRNWSRQSSENKWKRGRKERKRKKQREILFLVLKS